MITARHAQAQDRTVYALPGAVGNKNSEASNLLIKSGARLITSAEDVIKDFDNAEQGLLNPFNLKIKLPVDISDTLSKYGVVAVCGGDDIFNPPRPKRRDPRKIQPQAQPKVENTVEIKPEKFSKGTLEIYKRIPETGECSIDSLVDEAHPLREVMKLLLRLEMDGFIKILPGEAVMRKFN